MCNAHVSHTHHNVTITRAIPKAQHFDTSSRTLDVDSLGLGTIRAAIVTPAVAWRDRRGQAKFLQLDAICFRHLLPSGGHNSEVVGMRSNGDAVRLRPRDRCHLNGTNIVAEECGRCVRVRPREVSLEGAPLQQGTWPNPLSAYAGSSQ